MSVNPLDLQTNFIHIGTVGKKEVLSREQEILRQEHAAEHIKKEENKTLEDVPAATKTEGLLKTKENEDKEKKNKNSKKGNESGNSDNEPEDDTEKENKKNKENGVGERLDLIG